MNHRGLLVFWSSLVVACTVDGDPIATGSNGETTVASGETSVASGETQATEEGESASGTGGSEGSGSGPGTTATTSATESTDTSGSTETAGPSSVVVCNEQMGCPAGYYCQQNEECCPGMQGFCVPEGTELCNESASNCDGKCADPWGCANFSVCVPAELASEIYPALCPDGSAGDICCDS
jgi:hypothetical protein